MTLRRLRALLGDEALAPGLRRALSAASAEGLAVPIGPGVVAFPVLTRAGCERLCAEVDRRAAAHPAERPPNSMHRYGAVLGELGLAEELRELRVELVEPLARLHLAEHLEHGLEGEYGFLAEYGSETDEDLGFHVDDSAVTLNLCLSEDFSGSELYFHGVRCDEHRQVLPSPDESFEYAHEPGIAVLHAGRHRHGVHPILRGRRRNLILWCQSDAAREAARSCRPWCGVPGR
jgi:hypothetical protein